MVFHFHLCYTTNTFEHSMNQRFSIWFRYSGNNKIKTKQIIICSCSIAVKFPEYIDLIFRHTNDTQIFDFPLHMHCIDIVMDMCL